MLRRTCRRSGAAAGSRPPNPTRRYLGRHPHCSGIKLAHLEESDGKVSMRILSGGAMRPFWNSGRMGF
ncbi:hypothetical protein ACFX12_033831 [Malus domestica]